MASIKKTEFEEQAFEEEFEIQDDDEPFSNTIDSPIKVFYKGLKIFYQCAYYYFLPFIALVFYHMQIDNNS
jgi:hypothetical protein